MRTFVFLTVALAGCAPQFVELKGEGDRIWLMSPDRKEVWRCIDSTPRDTPYQGGLVVFCKQAYLYDQTSNPGVEFPKSKTMTTEPTGNPLPPTR